MTETGMSHIQHERSVEMQAFKVETVLHFLTRGAKKFPGFFRTIFKLLEFSFIF